MTVSSLCRLKVALEKCANRAEADPREYWENWEFNMGPSMYNKWVTCYEFLQAELAIEPIRMQPENKQIREHHEKIGAELPWIRVCSPPLYRKVGAKMWEVSDARPVYCRFEGRYKWTWTIWSIQKPWIFFGKTIYSDTGEVEQNAQHYTKAAFEEPDLDFEERVNAKIGEIGTNFSIKLGSDNAGWLDIVSRIIDVERQPGG